MACRPGVAALCGDTCRPMSELSPEVRRRRTFAIISHPDAGKTTLTEKLLLFAGAIHIAGSVKARKATRHATSDWMEIEKQRGISVASSVMQMEYRDCVINLLDTPGHQDFSEDTYRVLTAVDAALMVIDAANGVEPQTLRLLAGLPRAQHADHHLHQQDGPRGARAAGADRRDRARARHERRAVHLAGRHGQALRRRVRPARGADARVRAGRGPQPATTTRSSTASTTRPTPSASATRSSRRKNEIELVRGAAPAFDEAAFLAGRQTPVFFGSAINNFGVREVLDALVDLAPPPGERAAMQRVVAARRRRSSPASSSRSRPTWTRRTATASRSCACARAASSAACS